MYSSGVKTTQPVRVDGLFRTELSSLQQTNTETNLKEFNERKTMLQSYPRRVLLELTNMCNYRCIMCGRSYKSFRPSYMDINIVESLGNVFTHAEEVTLFGWGEPTIHPEFSEIIKRLDNYGSLRKYILTNGSNLDYIQKMIKKDWIDILAVSLDGADPATNDSIRVGADFSYIAKKLKEIIALKDHGYRIPYINLCFVIMKRNVHQLPDMVRLTSDLGLPELKAVYLTSFDGVLQDETMWDKRDLYRKYLKEAQTLARQLGVFLKAPPVPGDDPAGTLTHRECSTAWRDLFIGADGSVRPCQSTAHKIADINNYDISSRKGFFDLWNGNSFIKFRETIDTPARMEKNCRTCYQSSHANWNQAHAHIQQSDMSIPMWDKL